MKPTRDGELIQKKSKVIGVSFGSDACTEHELGIRELRERFGMTDYIKGMLGRRTLVFGRERRVNREVPRFFRWHDGGEWQGMIVWKYSHPFDPTIYGARENENGLWTAWGQDSFGVLSKTKKVTTKLRTIYEAFERKDGAIWLGGSEPFLAPGLNIGIASNLPSHLVQAWAKADRERHEIQLAAEESGIERRLKAAGRHFFALVPKRVDGELVFWLNPCEQDRNNFGYFTVAELDQWIQGEGPVPKKEKRR